MVDARRHNKDVLRMYLPIRQIRIQRVGINALGIGGHQRMFLEAREEKQGRDGDERKINRIHYSKKPCYFLCLDLLKLIGKRRFQKLKMRKII